MGAALRVLMLDKSVLEPALRESIESCQQFNRKVELLPLQPHHTPARPCDPSGREATVSTTASKPPGSGKSATSATPVAACPGRSGSPAGFRNVAPSAVRFPRGEGSLGSRPVEERHVR
jgi:hypothetical protein